MHAMTMMCNTCARSVCAPCVHAVILAPSDYLTKVFG